MKDFNQPTIKEVEDTVSNLRSKDKEVEILEIEEDIE